VPPQPLTEIELLLYVHNVRSSQETRLWTSTACYGGSFRVLCVDDVHTSQRIQLWAPTSSYRDIFTFVYVDNVRTSQETHL
jgi:hypothetical protein